MAEEKKSIFRQKSLDRISSPEELDQYLQVIKPTTWIVLGAVIALLLGFVSWGFLGHLETVVNVAVSVEDGRAICFIPEDQSKYIESGEIMIGDQSFKIIDTGLAKLVVDASTPVAVKECGSLAIGDVVCPFEVNGNLEDGIYQGGILIERVKPIHFIIN